MAGESADGGVYGDLVELCTGKWDFCWQLWTITVVLQVSPPSICWPCSMARHVALPGDKTQSNIPSWEWWKVSPQLLAKKTTGIDQSNDIKPVLYGNGNMKDIFLYINLQGGWEPNRGTGGT